MPNLRSQYYQRKRNQALPPGSSRVPQSPENGVVKWCLARASITPRRASALRFQSSVLLWWHVQKAWLEILRISSHLSLSLLELRRGWCVFYAGAIGKAEFGTAWLNTAVWQHTVFRARLVDGRSRFYRGDFYPRRAKGFAGNGRRSGRKVTTVRRSSRPH